MQIRPLCPELEAKARAELHEDPQRIASDVQHIKDWLAKQPHLRARSGYLKGYLYCDAILAQWNSVWL